MKGAAVDVEAPEWTLRAGRDHQAAVPRLSGADPVSFEALYSLHRDRVYRYLRSRTHNQEDAVDLTQQVFLKAFDHVDSYRPDKGSALNWLLSIARNAAVDFHRRRTHDSIDGLEFQSLDDVEAKGIDRADAAAVRAKILALPAAKQDLLSLRYGAELSVREIADVTGKKPDAIYKELSRIIDQLKGELT